MTTLDNHIITSLDSLTEQGRDAAIKFLGKSKKKVVKNSNSLEKKKMYKSLFITKKTQKL